ncbi:MAG TPA: TA system VapC family ribonuclease toxin [Allosphingosinicella sp.]
MTYLLDVNVLVALLDPAHVFHDAAHVWFEREGQESWATCPLTENGAIRVFGHVRYPDGPGSPGAAAEFVGALLEHSGHVFWSDEISLFTASHVRPEALGTAAQVTDAYLLALAVHRSAKLATLDRRLSHAAVEGGAEALAFIG